MNMKTKILSHEVNMQKCLIGGLIALSFLVTPSFAGDWFVRAGESNGDGSKEKPFKDPAFAIEKAESGDSIHVAEGVYNGKLDNSNWVISVPDLKIFGGYDANFAERDPWRHPTELRFKKDSKVRCSGTLLKGEKDHSRCIIDGFILDQKENNAYASGEYGDIDLNKSPKDTIAMFSSPGVEIRNCIFINGASTGVLLEGEGCKFENNLVMNMAGTCLLELRGSNQAKATTIKNNTFLFAWSPNYGNGGPDGIGLKAGSGTKVEIIANVFQNCDNHGIFIGGKFDKVVLKNNTFRMNGFSNIKFFIEGGDVAIDDKNMGDIEDIGLKAAEGNEAADPGLGGLDPKWTEKFINRTSEERGKVSMDDWNQFRQLVGAPLVAEGGKGPTGFAMAYNWKLAQKLVPKSEKIGTHPKKLEVAYTSGGTATGTTGQKYETSNWETLVKYPQSIDGKRVEIPGVFGSQKAWYPIAGVTDKEYVGVELYDLKAQPGLPPLIYIKKGSNAEKILNAAQAWNGQGEPIEKFTFRGMIKFDPASEARFKGTLLVESIVPFTAKPAPETVRPTGRDWFVKVGAQSGDGSKEKPFKDPWQALEKCTPGDAIHVAEGEYFGKLKTGYWAITVRMISMLGGYDKDFTERNPWKHPTRLGYAKDDSKAWTSGAFIRGNDDHSGFILDGFVFDGSDVNKYNAEGSLIPDQSSRNGLVELSSPDCTVRNCLLVNGSLGSVTMMGDGGTIENNIIANFHLQSIQLTPGKNEKPYFVRNNTVLFTWYDRADGKGGTAVGSGVYTRGDVAFDLDSNILAFNDCQGCFTSSEPKRVKVTNNVFQKNLFADFTDGRALVFDDETLGKIGDAGFIACDGNKALDPQLPLDKEWMGFYLARTQVIPGKVKDDDWNKLRDLLDLPVRAEGGKAATNYARVYDWKKAILLFPKNPECKAGAKMIPPEVKFSAVKTQAAEPEKSYQAIEWKIIQTQVEDVAGKPVVFDAMIENMQDQYYVPGIAEADGWKGIQIMGPDGKESGLPIMGYFKKDSKVEQLLKNADRDAKYKIRGIARKAENYSRGCILIEGIEKGE